jgi:hypothetical protein
MSDRVSFPVPFLPMLLIAVLVGGISMLGINFFLSAKTRDVHTHFAIRQITKQLNQIDDANFPRTATDLIDRLRLSRIDLNSCKIQEEQILDGWGSPIITTYDSETGSWAFHSLGRDGKNGTSDDINAATVINRKGEQAVHGNNHWPFCF